MIINKSSLIPETFELAKSAGSILYDVAVENMYRWYPIEGDLLGGYECTHCNSDVDSIPSLSKHPHNECTYYHALLYLAEQLNKDTTEPIL